MKHILSIATIILIGTFSSNTFAQENYRDSNMSFSISGTSNIHDWTSSTNEGTMKGTFTIKDGALTGVSGVKVEIPVKSIKSPKGSIMDKKSWNALKYEQHPKITFTLNKISSIDKTGKGYNLKANGNLTIAGTTKAVDMVVNCMVKPGGALEITGSKAIKMTDFNVEPPTAMLGALTTGNDVTVSFNINLTTSMTSK